MASDDFKSTLRWLSSPLADYWEGVLKGKDDDLVFFLKYERPTSPFMARFALGSVIISTLIATIFRYKEGNLQFVEMPLLNELLMLLFFLAAAVVSAIIFQPLVIVFRGSGTFQQTVTTCLYFSVLFMPFYTLAEAITVKLLQMDVPNGLYFGSFYPVTVAIAKLHRISVGWFLTAYVGCLMVLLVAGIFLVVWWGSYNQ